MFDGLISHISAMCLNSKHYPATDLLYLEVKLGGDILSPDLTSIGVPTA